jgi:HSP20 family protein
MFANRLIEQMDRLFGPVGFDAPPFPPLNVWEDKDHFYVESELPGLKLDDIRVSVAEGNQLTIAGERVPDRPESGAWLRQECGFGEFVRTLTLPAAVDPDKVEARYEAGVLTLTLPKSDAAKPRRIAVRAGAPVLAVA